MKKIFTLLLGLLFFGVASFAQEWQQTASTPEGGGVTEILVHPINNHIFVTTSSFNFPYGDDGGVRRSMDDGDTWENLYDCYIGRTISYGADGNLYASIWPHPAHEGLYRSTDNGDNWELLTMIAYGNNIFSITISTLTIPVTIFAGTRDGVWRSIDNGTTWAYANEGIPWATWVRDIEVDSSGIVVAATTSGLFSSEDNGDTWVQATGAGIDNDTITKIIFDYPFDSKDGNTRLLAGSNSGKLYASFADAKYLQATLITIFAEHELSGISIRYLGSENKKVYGVSEFPKGTQPGGFSMLSNNGSSWQQNNAGIPGSSVPASALSGSSSNSDFKFKLGLFKDMNGGALVMKISYDWSLISGVEYQASNIPSGLNLKQNFPNPFDHNTVISYDLATAGPVSLKVYGTDGRLINTLVDSWQSKGEHQFAFASEGLTEGIYYYKMESLGLSEVRKMVILK